MARRWFTLATAPMWPIVWLVLMASLARLKLGYWPRYDQPDPKDLFWPREVISTGLAVVSSLSVLAGTFGLAILHTRYEHRRWWNWPLVLPLCCFAVFILWVWIDPGGLVEWAVD